MLLKYIKKTHQSASSLTRPRPKVPVLAFELSSMRRSAALETKEQLGTASGSCVLNSYGESPLGSLPLWVNYKPHGTAFNLTAFWCALSKVCYFKLVSEVEQLALHQERELYIGKELYLCGKVRITLGGWKTFFFFLNMTWNCSTVRIAVHGSLHRGCQPPVPFNLCSFSTNCHFPQWPSHSLACTWKFY